METKINWQQGTPTLEDIYLVAVELGPNNGYFDMSYWNGQQWSSSRPENIIGFLSFTELKQQLNFSWPKTYPEMDKAFVNVYPGKLDDWEEV